ncbi:hypothetical protein KM043_007970 [Ampulex compressa]|nr:hypothetical protein KM043_007970 [Ampulex compressa]
MNVLIKNVMSIARSYMGNSIEGSKSCLTRISANNCTQGSILNTPRICLTKIIQGFEQIRTGYTLESMHRKGAPKKTRATKNPLNGQPFAKGTVIKTMIKKPKKPNSANRKCVLVRLSNGKEMTAFIPGIGHNLQEHNVVLCKVKKLRDTPGVKITCVRGKYDLPHVVKTK